MPNPQTAPRPAKRLKPATLLGLVNLLLHGPPDEPQTPYLVVIVRDALHVNRFRRRDVGRGGFLPFLTVQTVAGTPESYETGRFRHEIGRIDGHLLFFLLLFFRFFVAYRGREFNLNEEKSNVTK